MNTAQPRHQQPRSAQMPTHPTAIDPANPPTGSLHFVPETMRAVWADRYGDPSVLARRDDAPIPQLGEHDVLVHVHAAALNPLDWHYTTGTPYFMRLMAGVRRPKRTTPGADLAGTVVALGSGVSEWRTGDAIVGETPRGGGCGEYAALDARHAVAKPDDVGFDDAAATPVAGLTAIQALRTHAAVQPGERVLINGAAGGVGTFAVQIAREIGAIVTGVCSTRNADMVTGLGADVVDYTVDDITRRVGEFDALIDNVGNLGAASVDLLADDGRYVMVSGPKRNRWLDPLPAIVRTRMRFARSGRSFHQFTASPLRSDLDALMEYLQSGAVVPQIDRTIGLDDVGDALTEIGNGHVPAKIVVHPA
ncbi:MAG: NAD(P)-dependent alcohol dehydrogenase [Actinomycetota bacterium]